MTRLPGKLWMIAVFWLNLAARAASISGSNPNNVTIPDAGGYVASTITVSGAPAGAVVTSIEVYFRCGHTYSSDLTVDLNADSTASLGNKVLWNREGGSADNPTRTTTGITTFNGLSPNRVWYLYARDWVSGDSGNIDEWSILITYSVPPAPSVATIVGDPITADPANNYQTITVNGGSFVNKPTVILTWTGQSGYTVPDARVTYVNSSQITMSIRLGAAADNWTLKVVNPDGQQSNVKGFTVLAPPPAPTITTVVGDPITADPANNYQTITLKGTFQNKPTLVLTWTGQSGYTLPASQVTFVDSTTVTMSIRLGAGADNWTVKAINPDGQQSNVKAFTVLAPTPAPSVANIAGDPITADPANNYQTITVNGGSFVNKPTVILTWTGQSGYTVPDARVTYVNGSQITISIRLGAAADNWTLKVVNPDGQQSNVKGFNVVTTPVDSIVRGLDVSHYQNDAGSIAWNTAFAAGWKFVFVKCSEADDVADGYSGGAVSDHTAENVQAARDAGLLVGVYHLARPDRGTSGSSEAAYFLGRANPYLTAGFLPPVLDLEGAYGLTRSQLSTWVRAWLQAVEARLNGTGKPIIYSPRGVLRDYLEADLLAYPLWIATDDDDQTGTPSLGDVSWPQWKFKQYKFGEHGGTAAGVTGPVDLNSFNGTLSALQSLAIKPRVLISGAGGGAVRPPVGGEMKLELKSETPQTVVIESSEDFVHWSPHAPISLAPGTPNTFTDPDAGAHAKRFYRIKYN